MTTITVALPKGDVTTSVARYGPDDADVTLVFGHGAGAGRENPFLTGFADGLATAGIATVLFNFPYAEAGRRMPGPAAHAVATWRAVRAWAADNGGTLWLGGKSYGGRMASMAVAGGLPAAGLVYLGYPLHPPGQPEKERSKQLPAITVPQLFVEGTGDPFIDPRDGFERVVSTCRDATVHWVEGGGHSFEVKGNRRPSDEIGRSLAPIVAAFIAARGATTAA